jgi:hypothetical protein
MTEHDQETVKYMIDGASILTVIGTLVEFLPAVSALLSIIWIAIRIYETDTVQRLVGRKKENSDASNQP